MVEDDFSLDASCYTAADAVSDSDASPKAEKKPEGKKGEEDAMRGILFFDLETVPDDERMHLFDLPPLRPIPATASAGDCPNGADLLKKTVKEIEDELEKLVPPADYLDSLVTLEKGGKARDGIFKAITSARKLRDDIVKEHADRLLLLSTTPEYCKICSMAAVIGGKEPVRCSPVGSRNSTGVVTEKALLQLFWDMLATARVVAGYHISGFDLPVIFFRSALLGVKPSRIIDTSPWKNDVLDLYQKRFPKGSPNNAGKLKQQAKLLGIEVPAGDVNGSCVYDLFKAKKYEEIAAYNTSDVAILRDYYLKFRGMYWK